MPYHRLVAYTLVDITSSGSTRVRDSNTKAYHQMQNLNVLLQTIGLRTQPIDHSVDVLENEELSKYNFDSEFTGIHTVWKLVFDIQHESIWQKDDDSLFWLKHDVDGIAVSVDLDETVDFSVNVFDANKTVNIYFEYI